MSKEEIMKDIKFREACSKYGLDWENSEVYGEVILLPTTTKYLYVIMDKNYNVFDIDKFAYDFERKECSKDRYYGYCNFTDILPYGENFGYPFKEYTLKQIIDLSNRVEIVETNQEHSLRTKVNGDWYDRDVKENENCFKLLSYIKFLGEEIKQYFLLSYHMQVMEFEAADVYSFFRKINVYAYVRQLIRKVNECVDKCISDCKRPLPADVLSFLGQNYMDENMNGILYDVISLLLTSKGYEIDSENPNKVNQITDLKSIPDLSKLAKQLLQILDLSDEELKDKEENDDLSLAKKPGSSFKYWLNRLSNIPEE